MLTHVTLGYNDLAKAKEFYDHVLEPLGYTTMMDSDSMKMYTGAEGAKFGILTPRDGNPATAGNGVTIGIVAPNAAAVDEFHKRALGLGGKDEGAPGPRPFPKGLYAAYVRDPGGHKICASCYVAE